MKWFGESWGAPVCEETEHEETPVGSSCAACPYEIEEGDRGVILPFYSRDRTLLLLNYHLACFVATIFPEPPFKTIE